MPDWRLRPRRAGQAPATDAARQGRIGRRRDLGRPCVTSSSVTTWSCPFHLQQRQFYISFVWNLRREVCSHRTPLGIGGAGSGPSMSPLTVQLLVEIKTWGHQGIRRGPRRPRGHAGRGWGRHAGWGRRLCSKRDACPAPGLRLDPTDQSLAPIVRYDGARPIKAHAQIDIGAGVRAGLD